MEIVIGWIVAILLTATAIMMFYLGCRRNKDRICITLGVIALIWSILLISSLIVSESCRNPSAIDVYRGKTTLQITYRDSIPVDSVVVFKNE